MQRFLPISKASPMPPAARAASAETSKAPDTFEPAHRRMAHELWLEVFSYLGNPQDLKRSTGVCTNWRRVAGEALAKKSHFKLPPAWPLEATQPYLERYPAMRDLMVAAHCPFRTCSQTDLVKWLEGLHQVPKLRSISLKYTGLNACSMPALAAALPPRVTGLDVSDCKLTTDQLAALAQHLGPNVKALNAERNCVDLWGSCGAPPAASLAANRGNVRTRPEHFARARALARALSKNLDHISVDSCGWDAAFLTEMLSTFAHSGRQFKTLSLAGLWMDAAAVRALLAVMPSQALMMGTIIDHGVGAALLFQEILQALPESLQTLQAHEPELGSEHLRTLTAKALPNLRDVQLFCEEHADAAAVHAFIDVLPEPLQRLYLYWHGHLPEVAVHAGKRFSVLRDFHTGGALTDAGLQALVHLWAAKQHVYLSYSELSAAGIKALAPHLHADLEVLCLSSNPNIGDAGVRALFGRLPASLRTLRLGHVGMSDAVALELMTYLPKGLHLLEVEGNALSEQTVAALQVALPSTIIRSVQMPFWHTCERCPTEPQGARPFFGSTAPATRAWPMGWRQLPEPVRPEPC